MWMMGIITGGIMSITGIIAIVFLAGNIVTAGIIVGMGIIAVTIVIIMGMEDIDEVRRV